MAFRHTSELPIGDGVLRVAVAGDDGTTVTLTLSTRPSQAAPGATESSTGAVPEQDAVAGSLRLPIAELPAVRTALHRALRVGEPGAGLDAEQCDRPGVPREPAPGGDCWVPQAEEELTRCFHRGHSVARLAARFGRSPESVRARLLRLGHDPQRPAYCPPDGCWSAAELAATA